MNPQALPDFSKLRVAVVGDLIADHYMVCEPRGLSREAPVMVLDYTEEHLGAGGAANVARNLNALGAETICLGAVGRDARGRELIEVLRVDGIDVAGILAVPDWVTTTKTRIVAAEPRRSLSQVLRVDRGPKAPMEDAWRRLVQERLAEVVDRVDAIVLSDYELGLFDPGLARAAARLSERLPVVLDPRSSLADFDGVTALMPNVGELARFTGRAAAELDDGAALASAARELRSTFAARDLVVTRGTPGMALFSDEAPEGGAWVGASGAGNVTDVTGAGDTAAAVYTLALAAGLDSIQAMTLANAASGVVVMEHGAAVCTPAALRDALPIAPSPGLVPN